MHAHAGRGPKAENVSNTTVDLLTKLVPNSVSHGRPDAEQEQACVVAVRQLQEWPLLTLHCG